MSEEVILTTLHFGNFRLVPILEGEESYHRPNVDVPSNKNYSLPEVADHNRTTKKESTTTVSNHQADEVTSNTKKGVESANDTKEIVDTSKAGTTPKTVVENKEIVNTSWADKPRQNEEFDKAFAASQENKESSNKSDYSVRTSESNGSTIIIEERIEPETNRVFEPFTPPVITKKPTRVIVDGSIEDWELEEQSRGSEVFVDPSLLSLEDALKQQGLEPDKPKKGIFGRLFGRKK